MVQSAVDKGLRTFGSATGDGSAHSAVSGGEDVAAKGSGATGTGFAEPSGPGGGVSELAFADDEFAGAGGKLGQAAGGSGGSGSKEGWAAAGCGGTPRVSERSLNDSECAVARGERL